MASLQIFTPGCILSVRHRSTVVIGTFIYRYISAHTFMYTKSVIVIPTFMLQTWKPVALTVGSSMHETGRYVAVVSVEVPALETNRVIKILR